MNFIEANGVSLRYAVQGSGKALVLIHEMGGTMESWDLVVPALSASRRVVRSSGMGGTPIGIQAASPAKPSAR